MFFCGDSSRIDCKSITLSPGAPQRISSSATSYSCRVFDTSLDQNFAQPSLCRMITLWQPSNSAVETSGLAL